MERYLINYLYKTENNKLVKKYIEYFKVELDWFIYNYGDHMSKTHCRNQKFNLRRRIIDNLQYFNAIIKKRSNIDQRKPNIFSCVSVPFLEGDYNVYCSILQPIRFTNIIGDVRAVNIVRKIRKIINNGSFKKLIDPVFIGELEKFRTELKRELSAYSFKGAFFPTDQYFEDKFLIEIFRELGVPTFIFMHGLPASYTPELDSRSDYLLLWGEKMKECYIRCGFDPKKILVSGCRKIYNNVPVNQLRNSYEDVLIIPSSSVLWHQDTWDEPRLIDRSMGVLYLYQVENTLKKIGVTKARFRVHPSISARWTSTFLDMDFYTVDKLPLSESLEKATLVIGATSTVLFDALSSGVNYLIYEPQENSINMLRYPVVPPFNGEDNVPVAMTEDELFSHLQRGVCTDINLLNDYISPFDANVIKKML